MRSGGRSLLRYLVLLSLLWPAFGAVRAAAQAVDAAPEGPQALLARAFDNLYGDDYVQILTLSTRRRGGQAMVRRIQLTRKQSVRPGKALVRFLAPPPIRNTGVLILENEGAYDDMWVFLPALNRTRRISGSQRADSFFGSDLTYEDIEPKHASDWEARAVGEDVVAGVPCRVLEVLPRDGFESVYEKMVSCIDPERGTILRTDFWQRGVPMKHLEVDTERIEAIAGRNIPFRMTLDTPGRRSETLVETQRYDIRDDLADRLFTVANLELGDAGSDARDSNGGPD